MREKKSQKISIRITERDFKCMEKDSRTRYEIFISGLYKKDIKIIKEIDKEKEEFRKEFKYLNNNINQIAKRLNMGEHSYFAKELKEIKQYTKGLFEKYVNEN